MEKLDALIKQYAKGLILWEELIEAAKELGFTNRDVEVRVGELYPI